MTDNVFSIVDGAKGKEDSLPQFPFVIETLDGGIHEVYGFPVFAPQYIMIMREFPGGQTVPVFMLPLTEVKSFELDEIDNEDEQDDLPA